MRNPTVLLIEDMPATCQTLKDVMTGKGYDIFIAAKGGDALQILASRLVDLVLCDQKLPDIDGKELVRRIKDEHPNLPIIVITAYANVESAADLMHTGAFYYLSKPINFEMLFFMMAKALEQRKLLLEVESLRTEVQGRYQLIGRSKPMQDVFNKIERMAATDMTVLVCGETGTGKELVAKALHYSGHRKKGPFVEVNCARFRNSNNLLESDLFGHERGSFTGAVSDKKGNFELADGGTLFLDEIEATSSDAQAELLKVLEDRSICRVGGTRPIQVDVRVIAATNENLKEWVNQGKFRKDLFFRLDVFPIVLPPLKERKGDIPLLAEHFLKKHSPNGNGQGTPAKVLAPETLRILDQYEWPGNVRELENQIQRLLYSCDQEVITPEYLSPEFIADPKPEGALSLLDQTEKEMIRKAVEEARGNYNEAADRLGITRKVLWDRRKRYGLP
jgi:DNA-binding NtrC family response regulator